MKVLKRHLVMKDRPGIDIIPNTKTAVISGERVVAIPHTLDVVRYLRNLDIKAPSPIHTEYRWAGVLTPMRHQRITADMATVHKRMFILNGMGTGKTAAITWAVDYLIQTRNINKVLIISPRSTLRTVWGNHLYQHFPHIHFEILQGSKETRVEKLNKNPRIAVINPEGTRVIPRELLNYRFDAIIIDELAQCARNKHKTYDAIKMLADKATWVWGMTGTPTPNAPTDAYHQIRMVLPNTLNMSFRAFRDLTMRQITQFKWEAREDAERTVAMYMRPCVRFSMDDCALDLPPTTYTDLEVELTADQKKHYKALLDDSVTQVKDVDITAVNAAVLVSKLIQTACGVLYGTEKQIAKIDMSSRYEALRDVIDGCAEKVIVFVPFTSVINVLHDKLVADKYGVAVIDGSTSDAARAKIFDRFQTESRSSLQVIIAHPKTMSHGLTLVAASTIVWYAPYLSNDVYTQANARIVRPGQTKHTTIVRISGTATERRVYKSLEDKGRLQQALLDVLRGQHET